MAGASIEDFEVHVSPSLLLPYALEQCKRRSGMRCILLNEQIREPAYVCAAGVYKERGGEERRLEDDISARC